MGISISEDKYQKMEKLRREGRLCQSGDSRAGCAIRATVRSAQETWTYRIGEGESQTNTAVFCLRHARRYALPGSEGVNFRVLSTERF